jgi:hypothetical protein
MCVNFFCKTQENSMFCFQLFMFMFMFSRKLGFLFSVHVGVFFMFISGLYFPSSCCFLFMLSVNSMSRDDQTACSNSHLILPVWSDSDIYVKNAKLDVSHLILSVWSD